LENILLLLLLGFLGWFWMDATRAKDIAREAGRSACKQAEVQFLDDTVAVKKTWLRRNKAGSIEICRLYFFEFARTGAQRYYGRVVLLGMRIGEVEMDAFRLD